MGQRVIPARSYDTGKIFSPAWFERYPNIVIMRNRTKFLPMQEPPVKKILYWCPECNIPLIGRSCACGREGSPIKLLEPYDVRPALDADRSLIAGLIRERFGDCQIPRVLLLNKAGGTDRNDLVIANGSRFGWLTFDPVSRQFRFDLSIEAVGYLIAGATRGIVDLEASAELPPDRASRGRIGGKKFRVRYDGPDGTVIVRYRGKFGTGVVNDNWIRVREVGQVTTAAFPDPDWDEVIEKNRYHLKNLERNAIRAIKQFIGKRPVINVSFSGGKDSSAVLMLARKAGVKDAFFIDTGIEFPETIDFVRSMGVEIVSGAGDFFNAVPKAGPPSKDNRWCCKLLKQNPLRVYLAKTGPCITLQGNRWYESWNRSDLELAANNPLNPLQMNISPIRNWRALEVFLYLWWQKAPENPLYNLGVERIGCYPCPSMLESEFECLKNLHPDLATRWSDVLLAWAEKKGLPEEYVAYGLWRWKSLPKKMQELCRTHHIGLAGSGDSVVLAADPGRRGRSPPPAATDWQVSPLNGSGPSGITRPAPEGLPVRAGHSRGIAGVPGDMPAGGPVTEDRQVAPFTAGDAGKDKTGRIRQDFSLLTDLVYLDNTTMTLSPEPVIGAMIAYERTYRALPGTGSHRLAGIAYQRYWHAHEKVEKFIGGGPGGVTVFTHSVREALETVRNGIRWKADDEILAGQAEPRLSVRSLLHPGHEGRSQVVLPISKDYTPDLEQLGELTAMGTIRLLVISHVSDLFGSIAPLEEISRICHENGTQVLVDGSHAVSRIPIDVERLGVDFFCFPGHTMLGPTGTAVLWVRDPGTLQAAPGLRAGAIPGEKFSQGIDFAPFEQGTPNIAGSIGLGAAADYLAGVGMGWVRDHDLGLTERLIAGLSEIKDTTIFAPQRPGTRIGNVSFSMRGIDPGDIVRYLEEEADILAGAGTGDTRERMEDLGFPGGVVKAGISLYNNEFDVDSLLASVAEISRGV